MNKVEKLSKYGLVVTCKLVTKEVATIVVKDGFKASKSLDFLKECAECFPNLPIVETCITENDFAMVVLKSKED